MGTLLLAYLRKAEVWRDVDEADDDEDDYSEPPVKNTFIHFDIGGGYSSEVPRCRTEPSLSPKAAPFRELESEEADTFPVKNTFIHFEAARHSGEVRRCRTEPAPQEPEDVSSKRELSPEPWPQDALPQEALPRAKPQALPHALPQALPHVLPQEALQQEAPPKETKPQGAKPQAQLQATPQVPPQAPPQAVNAAPWAPLAVKAALSSWAPHAAPSRELESEETDTIPLKNTFAHDEGARHSGEVRRYRTEPAPQELQDVPSKRELSPEPRPQNMLPQALPQAKPQALPQALPHALPRALPPALPHALPQALQQKAPPQEVPPQEAKPQEAESQTQPLALPQAPPHIPPQAADVAPWLWAMLAEEVTLSSWALQAEQVEPRRQGVDLPAAQKRLPPLLAQQGQPWCAGHGVGSVHRNAAGTAATWIVDGKRLQGKDTHLSKTMHFNVGMQRVELVVSLSPKPASEARGGASFMASSGLGCIRVKCNQLLEAPFPLRLELSGDVEPLGGALAFEVAHHDFASNPVVVLPGECDFRAAAKSGSLRNGRNLFAVTLVVASASGTSSEVLVGRHTIAPTLREAEADIAAGSPTAGSLAVLAALPACRLALRRADGVPLGLDVVWLEATAAGGDFLAVRGVLAEGAVEAFNRQCSGDPLRALAPGDGILSVNGCTSYYDMVQECHNQHMLVLTVARGACEWMLGRGAAWPTTCWAVASRI